MRILHITQCPLPGGIGSYFEEMAAYQIGRYGQDVSFLVPQGNARFLPSVPRSHILEFPFQRRDFINLMRFTYHAVAAIRAANPDIVHLHSTFAGALLRPLIRLMPNRPKVVYCPHGWAFMMEVPAWRKFCFRLIEQALSPLADKIINISQTDYADARRAHLPPSLMVTVRNGIAWQTPIDAKPVRNESSPDPIRLLFVGRLDRQKGLDLLLTALENVSETHLHLDIVGAPVVDGNMPGLSLAGRNITVLGWKSRAETLELITKADAVIVPSRWEGFGLVAVEAMRAGKPVIASRRGALPEIIKPGVTGLLFSLEHPSELLDLLRNLNKRQLHDMGKAARAKFEAEFTADRMNRELEAVYVSLLSELPEALKPSPLPHRREAS